MLTDNASGCSALISVSSDDTLLVQNLCDGVDEYKLPTLELVRKFHSPVERNYIWQVVPACDGEWMVVGGDNGTAQIFDRRTGLLLHNIAHGSGQ